MTFLGAISPVFAAVAEVGDENCSPKVPENGQKIWGLRDDGGGKARRSRMQKWENWVKESHHSPLVPQPRRRPHFR